MVRKKIPVIRASSLRAEVTSVPGAGPGRSRPGLPWDEPWAPVLDVCEKEDRVVVEAELAGVEPGDVTLLVHHNRVEIRGRKKRELHKGPAHYHRLERPSGVFRRTVSLPCLILPDRTQALLDDGVLKVVLFKAGGAKPWRKRPKGPAGETAGSE